MSDLIGQRWDEEYQHGRYGGEPPIPFIAEILKILHATGRSRDAGLYVGCGNGRNYLPLVDAGANLHGIDIAPAAIRSLLARRPAQKLPVLVGDFRSYRPEKRFGYLIAIQVFQHGTEGDAGQYFTNVAAVLRDEGFFFLRVNSCSTEMFHRHTLIERNEHGGFTIRYEDGPKRGLPVHFYARDELLAKGARDFELVSGPREDVTKRAPPKTGSWAQWEVVWRRRRRV